MKKIVSLILGLGLCFSLAVAAACGSKCSHPEESLELKSTTATCAAAGTETYGCTACGKYETTKDVEAYGHVYTETVEVELAQTSNTLTPHNKKCKYCDLLQYNVDVKELPESVTTSVHLTARETTVKTCELTVDGWVFFRSSDKSYFRVTATPTFAASYNSAGPKRFFLGVKFTDGEGKTSTRLVQANAYKNSPTDQAYTEGEKLIFDLMISDGDLAKVKNTQSVTFGYEILSSITADYDGNYGVCAH